AAQELLTWLADDHFTFLGCREYSLEPRPTTEGEDDLVLRPVPGSGLGILRAHPDLNAEPHALSDAGRLAALARTPLVLTKANSRATVHRRTHLAYVGVLLFAAAGSDAGQHRFLGLFSSGAYTESILRIPVL